MHDLSFRFSEESIAYDLMRRGNHGLVPRRSKVKSLMVHKILYVSRTWAMGGAQSIILSLIRSLPKDRFQIYVAPFRTDCPADAQFEKEAAKAGATLTEPIDWRGWKSWRSCIDTIGQLTETHNIDLVHVHDNVSNLITGLSRKKLRTPIVASAYGWWELNTKLKLLYALEKRLGLTRMDGVYTVSEDMARKLRLAGVSDEIITVIHTGIDLETWSPQGSREQVRRQFGIPAASLVVGSVGRISSEKGYDHLLHAVNSLREELPDLAVLLVGKGPDMGRLAALANELAISDRVFLPGYFENGAAALEATDIAVLPSVLDEGFPTASMEAQAVGLPIIASDIGGTRETIEKGITGLLVEPGNRIELAEAIRFLASNDKKRQEMGQAAKERIARDFSLKKMIAEMAEFYDLHIKTK